VSASFWKAAGVVALFVDRNGIYPKRVAEWYDDKRDARTYRGNLPVVAHPPCQAWCRLAGLVEARWGKLKGDDGGLFAFALATLRRVGGVIEHPAYSDAWEAHGLPRPVTGGAWTTGARRGEWTCYVEQWRYGHRARKATWLYYVGARRPPALRFGYLDPKEAGDSGLGVYRGQTRAERAAGVRRPSHTSSFCSIRRDAKGVHGSSKPKLTKKEAISTPPAFREELIKLARWAGVDTW
jgi:hypothetical protein